MSIKTNSAVAAKYFTALARGEVTLELLDPVKNLDAERNKRKIRDMLDEASSAVELASARPAKIRELKASVQAQTVGLRAAVNGTQAIIESSSPEIAAKLPDKELWSDAAPHEHAEHMIIALREIGTPLATSCADNLEVVDKRRERTVRELTELESTTTMLTKADNAVARLNLAVAEADIFLRDIAVPGSSLAAGLAALHGNRKGKSKSRSSKPKTTSPAPSAGQSAGAPSPSPAPEAPAAVSASPHPTPPTPTLPVATPAPTPAPVVVAQPPVAVPPASSDAGAVAVMNGAAGAQLNGSAH